MKTSSVLATVSLASLGAATDILLPLYLYPLTGAWDPVYNAASAYPDVTFRVIVDVDSGPGGSQYPDSSYTAALATLNSYSNIKTIGYVHTTYTGQDISAVEANVSTYAGWKDYSGSSIAVNGIFFDEAPYIDNSGNTTYMASVASYARDQGLDYIIFNPGTLTTVQAYYDAADLIVNEEIAYSSYSKSSTVDIIPTEYRDQSAIIMHDTPSSADIASLVNTMVSAEIAAFYATEDCCYNAIDTTMLDNIASALESA